MGRVFFWKIWTALILLFAAASASAQDNYVLFESGPVRPLALSPDGTRLFLCNIPDARLEIFAVSSEGLTHLGSVPVGLEPVAVAARSDGEVWVVNHLSDSVSIVDVAARRVTRTLLVGDEPRDIVFAGASRERAFITAAHRGQNRPGDPQLLAGGVGRSDVWVFDSTNLGAALGGTPLTLLNLFGDTPRALAVTPDGSKVYAAVFHSGNQTTVIPQGQVPQPGPFQTLPANAPPPDDTLTITNPPVGVMARYESGTTWRGPTGAAYTNKVPFLLPDHDVFAINALATPPVQTGVYDHVGTILFNMIVNPVSGAVYVTNTDANNMDRFEGFGTPNLRGELHKARISILTGASTVTPRHLNRHIDYGPAVAPPEVNQASLGIPTEMAITSDGTTLFVAAFGSQALGVIDTASLALDPNDPNAFQPSAASHIPLSAGGPGGLVFDELHYRLYVYTRFDEGVSVVDAIAHTEVAHLSVHNPESQAITVGRRFLYDTQFSSSNGEASCGVCHVFGDFDSLAWDLGAPSPDGAVVPNNNLFVKVGHFQFPGFNAHTSSDETANPVDFHPLKGPMTTQTLRGMDHGGPMHWRGDRSGGGFSSRIPAWDGDPNSLDENQGFLKFNPAFVGLLGRANQLSPADMQAFATFILKMQQPPNPIRNLDGTLDASQAAGLAFFVGPESDAAQKNCSECHILDPAIGAFGTKGLTAFQPVQGETQHFKVPHLRNQYQKVGMFGRNVIGLPQHGSAISPVDQIRGFGFFHDGSTDTCVSFLEDPAFTYDPPAAAAAQRINLTNFMMAFPTDLAPVVGQQVTLTAANAGDSAIGARLDLLVARAGTAYVDADRSPNNECDLVVKGLVAGAPRGWWMSAPGVFTSDKSTEPTLTDAELRAVASVAGQDLTYTCAPPGSGPRMGIDRGGVGDASQPDGIRDAEQCGDVTADGVAAGADVAAIRAQLAELDPPAAPGKCNVIDDPLGPAGSCDILDVAVLRRALAGQSPSLSSACNQ